MRNPIYNVDILYGPCQMTIFGKTLKKISYLELKGSYLVCITGDMGPKNCAQMMIH